MRGFAQPSGGDRDAGATSLRVASYNVHACVGLDGRRDAGRVASVIRELDADVIVLQEVLADGAAEAPDQFSFLADSLGLHAVEGPTLHDEVGRYGNVVLTRLPVADVDRLDLSVTDRESRGAVSVDVAWRGVRLRVVGTHLGLQRVERRRQVDLLLDWMDGEPTRARAAATVLAGDMNEWIPLAGSLRRLHRRFGRPPSVRTFPASRPLLHLDRIWVAPRRAVRRLSAHRSPLARVASDHLPVLAELAFAAAPGVRRDDRSGSPPAAERSARAVVRRDGHGDCTPSGRGMRNARRPARADRRRGAAMTRSDGTRRSGGGARHAATALVVQGNRDEGSVLAAWLRRCTERVVTVGTGSEALSVARDVVPDWIFVDDALPDMSSHELAHRVRSSTELESAQIVAVVDDARERVPAGFDDVLRRPLHGEQLDRLLHGGPDGG